MKKENTHCEPLGHSMMLKQTYRVHPKLGFGNKENKVLKGGYGGQHVTLI